MDVVDLESGPGRAPRTARSPHVLARISHQTPAPAPYVAPWSASEPPIRSSLCRKHSSGRIGVSSLPGHDLRHLATVSGEQRGRRRSRTELGMYRERCRRDACAPGGAWKARDPARASAPRASSPRPPRPDEFSVDSPRPDEFSGEVSRAPSFCYRAAVLRGGTAVAVPPLRLPSYSLRSYPFHFFFF